MYNAWFTFYSKKHELCNIQLGFNDCVAVYNLEGIGGSNLPTLLHYNLYSGQ